MSFLLLVLIFILSDFLVTNLASGIADRLKLKLLTHYSRLNVKVNGMISSWWNFPEIGYISSGTKGDVGLSKVTAHFMLTLNFQF